MEQEPPSDHSTSVSLGEVLATAALILFAVGLWLACYFIVPKIEVSWHSQGKIPPGWATGLFSASHFFIDYWYVALILLPLLVWLRREK